MFLLLLACAAPDPDPAGPLTTAEGRYTVTVATEPELPLAGEVTLLVDAPDATSLVVDGEMVGMGHGFAEEPVVDGGDGVFEAMVNCSMSGTWALTLAFDGEPGPDTLSTELDVR